VEELKINTNPLHLFVIHATLSSEGLTVSWSYHCIPSGLTPITIFWVDDHRLIPSVCATNDEGS